ncbi:MAG TPA: glycine cleavage system protein GcvH [Acholeplasmataceae bacterium]|nr:glycine cleavage system protein GcvH [Acholeplasmataceae bacterium]
MSKILENLKYLDSHEWVKVEGEYAYIGITDYAQDSLGSIVYIEVGEVGDEVVQGEEFGAVESVKAASDLISPLSGEIVEVNEKVLEDPEDVNTDPYGSWFIKIKVKDINELEKLLDAKGYEEILD